MSASRCFTAWNEPIGRSNCWRSLAYATARSVVASAKPSICAATSAAPARRQRAASSASASGAPRGRPSTRCIGVSGSRGSAIGSASNVDGSITHSPASSIATTTSSASRCPITTSRSRSTTPTTAASTSPAARWVPARGPGTSARPAPRTRGQPDATVALGQAQREHSRLGQLTPERAVDTTGVDERAHARHREAPLTELAHTLLQRLLVGAELEVHAFSAPRATHTTAE